MAKKTAVRETLEQIDVSGAWSIPYPECSRWLPAGRHRAHSQEGQDRGRSLASKGATRSTTRSASSDDVPPCVRYMTLTHSTTSIGPTGDRQARHKGLTKFGEQVVAEMNKLGMWWTFRCLRRHDAARSEGDESPVIASHSSAFAWPTTPRNVPAMCLLL